MRAAEAHDAGRLAAAALAGTTRAIADVHAGVAGRVFGVLGPAAAPVRVVHDGVTRGVYPLVGAALAGTARAAGAVGALRATGGPLDAGPAARVALAVVNGTHGDTVERVAPSLALPMTVRRAGRDVPVKFDALRAAFPAARPTVVVFLHGLTETEGAWCYRSARHHGARGVTFGTLLERDLGCTAVFLRYATGRHVSDNGRRLSDLLAALVHAWPVEVTDLVLVGHSMGGLVARSALHLAHGGTDDALPWARLVRDTVTLGTPHLGAPLERAAHRATGALARLPETRALARLLAARSVGVKDLRHGTVVEGDWQGRDLDATGPAQHTAVPVTDGARHLVVLATVPRDPAGRAAELVGDLLVPPRSAAGEGLGIPADAVHRLGRLHHFDLLSSPRVYDRLRTWLADRPPRRDDPAAG